MLSRNIELGIQSQLILPRGKPYPVGVMKTAYGQLFEKFHEDDIKGVVEIIGDDIMLTKQIEELSKHDLDLQRI